MNICVGISLYNSPLKVC